MKYAEYRGGAKREREIEDERTGQVSMFGD